MVAVELRLRAQLFQHITGRAPIKQYPSHYTESAGKTLQDIVIHRVVAIAHII
jgi:hypothetical protein